MDALARDKLIEILGTWLHTNVKTASSPKLTFPNASGTGEWDVSELADAIIAAGPFVSELTIDAVREES